jgi:hypothetical protein
VPRLQTVFHELSTCLLGESAILACANLGSEAHTLLDAQLHSAIGMARGTFSFFHMLKVTLN